MRLTLATSLALATLPAARVQDGALPQDLLRLVPEKAVVVALSSSIDELERAAESAMQAVDAEVPEVGLAASLLTPLGYFDLEALDRSRPFGIAVSLEGEGMPQPSTVLLLPARDAEALAASAKLPSMYAEEVVRGSYVAFPYGTTYAPGDGEPGLADGMAPGLLDARVDLRVLVQAYGPQIQMGLAMARGMYESMEVPESPIDVAKVMGLYLDGAQALLASVDRLDLHAGYDAGELEVWGDLSLIEGSPFSGFHSEAAIDYAPVARYLRGSAMMSFAANLGDGSFQTRMQPILERLLELYPESMREAMLAYTRGYMDLGDSLGRTMVASADFGAGGMRVDYHLAAPDPEAGVAGVVALLEEHHLDLEAMGMGMGQGTTREVDGTTVHTYAWTIDAEAMAKSMGPAASGSTEQMQQMFDAIYGKDLVWAIGAPGDRAAMYVGGASGPLEQVFAKEPPADGGMPAELGAALERLAGAAPAMAMRMDVGSAIEMGVHMGAATGNPAAAQLGALGDLPPFPVTMFAGFRAEGIRGGVSLDLARFRAFARAMEEGEPK